MLTAQSTPAVSAAHPFYISVTEIHYNPETRAYEVAMKLFLDDLEKGLGELGVQRGLPLGQPGESPESDSLLVRYLKQSFWLSNSVDRLPWRYLGREQDLQAVWVYVEVPNTPPAARLLVHQAVLTEVLPDQKNMVHVYQGEAAETAICMRGDLEALLELR